MNLIELSNSAYRVLVSMILTSPLDGRQYSFRQISAMTKLSETGSINAIKELESKGFIMKIDMTGINVRGKDSNLYTILYPIKNLKDDTLNALESCYK